MLLERLAAPADRVRLVAYRALGPRLARALADRETRVATVGTVHLFALFAAVCVAPALVLAWGPLLLGVPHLAADLRYLVVRPGLARRRAAWIAAAPVLAATWLWPHAYVGFCAPLAAILATTGDLRRRAGAALACVGLIAVAARSPAVVDLVLAHAHNLVGLAFFWAWRARRGRGHWLPIGAFAACGGALLLGAAGDADLARFLPGPTELVAFFAFAQGAHYLAWLRLVPDEDRPRPAPRSWRASARALVADLGLPLALAIVLGTLVVVGWGLVDADAARLGYLRVAIFHGHLELVAAALLFVEARRPVEATA